MEISNQTPFADEALPFVLPDGKTVLTVIVKGTFELRPNGEVAVAESQIPVAFGDEYIDEKKGGTVKFESDIVPFKPRADIVLVGKAYAPGGRPVGVLDVSLRVGRMSKEIRVFGDRKWIFGGDLMPAVMTEPVPFTSMELTYERAFGGMDLKGGGHCEENLVGRGYIGKEPKKGEGEVFLPNLEDPKNLIRSWKDKPKPVGFGFYGRAWKPRAQFLGTYDEKWRKERSPDPPVDFKNDYYNAAHPDLQAIGYLKGDEEVRLVNLSPKGEITFRLPGVIPKVSVMKSDEYTKETLDEENPGGEQRMNMDTICLMPEVERFFMVWRGFCPMKNLTLPEIITIKVGSL